MKVLVEIIGLLIFLLSFYTGLCCFAKRFSQEVENIFTFQFKKVNWKALILTPLFFITIIPIIHFTIYFVGKAFLFIVDCGLDWFVSLF